jgi:hypothetical protein
MTKTLGIPEDAKRVQGFYKGSVLEIYLDPALRGTFGRFKGLEGADLERFAQRLERDGQDVPIEVYILPQDHPARAQGKSLGVVDGANRYTAINLINQWRKEKGEQEFPILYKVREDLHTPEDLFLLTVRANLDREDLGPIDHALNMRHAQEQFKWTGSKVAEYWGVTPASVSQRLSLIDRIDRKYWDYVNDGRIPVSIALAAIALPNQKLKEDFLAEVAKRLDEGGEKFPGTAQMALMREMGQRDALARAGAAVAPAQPAAPPKQEGAEAQGPAEVQAAAAPQGEAAPAPPPPAMVRQRSLKEIKDAIASLQASAEGKPDLSDPMTRYHYMLEEFIASRVDLPELRNTANLCFRDSFEEEAPKAKAAPKQITGEVKGGKKGGKARAAA